MTDTELQPDNLDEDALRRRLVNRIALAGVAIVALLGGLAIIDSLYVAPAPPVAPKAAVTPVIGATVKQGETDAKLTAPAPETPIDSQSATPPEPPKPLAIPIINGTAEPEESSSSLTPLPRQPHPPVKQAEAKQLTTIKPSIPPSLAQRAQAGRHFILQMGVFNNVDNAQELFARLQKNGIPAQIEARVQVGPFKTKAEADAARDKLKAMGLDSGLLMAIRR